MVADLPRKGKEKMAHKKQIQVPTARQLPSGRWNVQLRIDGKSISITEDKENIAIAKAMAIKQGLLKSKPSSRSALTLSQAMSEYIAQRENILSPATIAGYHVIRRNRFKTLHNVKVSDISQTRWQKAVNAEATKISAKTLKNSAMFVQTVIAETTGERLTARLPQVVPNDLPWLTPEQIPTFLEAIKGSKYEIPALLALSSLRQSEIVALKRMNVDTDKGLIHVRGSAVRADDGTLVQRKENKNSSSRRTVPFLIPQLKDAILRTDYSPDDYIYPHYSNVLRLNINRTCAAAGLPEVGIHGLRRSFASLCYHLGVSEAVTMIAGGWSDIHTMRKIYTKVSEEDLKQQAEIFTGFFKSANGNANAS